MKKILRKAMTVVGSVALVGMTVGAAAAASYPSPFTSNTAVIVGANAAPSDVTSANLIVDNLDDLSSDSTTLVGGEGVTEEEVVLGGQIDFSGSEIDSTLTDKEIPSLLDEKITWDDGNGADGYDYHEEIVVGDMKVITTLDDEDLEGVALTNDEGFEYRFVFEEAMPLSASDSDEADPLYLTILGKEYEVQNMTASSIRVVTSEEYPLSVGESVVVDGKTFTIDGVYDGKAQINGQLVSEGSTKKIDGMQVKVDGVGYVPYAPETSNVILVIGEEITKTYNDGDEYIGQDESDPLWVWTISDPTADDGYIGVKYTGDIQRSDDTWAGDTIKYEGEGYIMPDNFAEVKLNGLTDVDYEDLKLSFDDSEDLFNLTESIPEVVDAGKVAVLQSSINTLLAGDFETNTLYLYYADNDTADVDEFGAVQVFAKDVDGDYIPTNRPRLAATHNLTAAGELASATLGTMEVGDTIMTVNVTITSNTATLKFVNPSGNSIDVPIGGDSLNATAGTFEYMGTSVEQAETTDVVIGSNNVGAEDGPIMDYYGTILSEASDVENEVDNDELTLSIPSDQVYASVSVLADGQANQGDTGVMRYTDAQVPSGMNLVVVGGSAINSVAADLLGDDFREAAFTAETGVAAGEFLIQSFDRSGNTALLVAGYNAADTEKAVTYLLNNDVDTSVGTKMKGTSATEATVVTA